MSAGASWLFVKLETRYYDDEQIIDAGEEAEVLYIRALCFCKERLTDGFVRDAHLARLGLTQVEKRAERLVAVGLWIRDEGRGGYWIKNWLDYNPSAEHVEAVRDRYKASSAKANHVRWHTGPESIPAADCELCVAKVSRSSPGTDSPDSDAKPEPTSDATSETPSDSDRTPQSQSQSQSQSQPLSPSPSANGRRGTRRRDPLFEAIATACYGGWDGITDDERGRANKAAKQLRKLNATPEEVQARAERYRKKYQNATCSPQALTGNWTDLAPEPDRRARVGGVPLREGA